MGGEGEGGKERGGKVWRRTGGEGKERRERCTGEKDEREGKEVIRKKCYGIKKE